jgi:hypothetical protein
MLSQHVVDSSTRTSSVVLLPLMLYWNTFSSACTHLSPSTPALPPVQRLPTVTEHTHNKLLVLLIWLRYCIYYTVLRLCCSLK